MRKEPPRVQARFGGDECRCGCPINNLEWLGWPVPLTAIQLEVSPGGFVYRRGRESRVVEYTTIESCPYFWAVCKSKGFLLVYHLFGFSSSYQHKLTAQACHIAAGGRQQLISSFYF